MGIKLIKKSMKKVSSDGRKGWEEDEQQAEGIEGNSTRQVVREGLSEEVIFKLKFKI